MRVNTEQATARLLADDTNAFGAQRHTITVEALGTVYLELILAQLRHDVDHLGSVLRDIRSAGPGLLWGLASALAAVTANGMEALCGGRQAAARKAARAYREDCHLFDTEVSRGAWRLVLTQLNRDADAVGDALEDLENRGGLDLVERVVVSSTAWPHSRPCNSAGVFGQRQLEKSRPNSRKR